MSESREQSASDSPSEVERRRPEENGAMVADVAQGEAPELDELVPVGDEQARVGTVVAERYRITQLIGTGGMGAVYRAEHVHMKKQVALKVLHREMTVLPEVVARFEREAVAAGRIEHPNVVQANDFGRLEDGACYLVLEYVDGETLSYVLDKEEVSIGRALTIALQIAEALEAAHEQQIVHRDLKPDNVMLVRSASSFERVKVLDFGIAKVSIGERGRSSRPLTQMGSVFGTPEYMAPEQAAGQRVDHRADLYALGLLTYRMIAGQPPFRASQVNQLLMMQITQAPPPLPEGVPLPVRELIGRLLEKDPNARLQSAADVKATLLHLIDTLPSESLTVSVAPRSQPEALDEDPASKNALVRLGATLDKSALGARVDVGGDSVPMWRLAVVGVVLVGLAAGLVSLLRSPAGVERSARPGAEQSAGPGEVAAAAPTAPAVVPAASGHAVREPDPELEQLIGRAFAGDLEALSALERRPPQRRSVREWLALGRGRAKHEKYLASMKAYAEALEMDPALERDAALRKDVASALRDGDAVEVAMDLAAFRLGAHGADMLYEMWVETREVTSTTQTAKKLLLSKEVRAHASQALAFLLEWREAMSCDDYRRLLPRASVVADVRALTLLTRLEAKNDCQLPAAAIQAAIAAVKDRPPPPR